MRNLCIPNPCSENWELMSPREKGRFCSVCNKCVIDFTQKQPQEIQEIIEEKQSENICGRFYNHQLNRKKDQSEQLKNKFFKYVPSGFQSSGIPLAIFSFILFLTGCSKPKDESCYTTTGVVVSETDTSNPPNHDYVLGEMKIEDDSVAAIPKEKENVDLKTKDKK
ncbi:hypothetical protein HNP38_001669 [Chryseobacterium defluvii]|uniref:Uncharacterized protein n=1 Tax=Chryseobacterium defluvii TaxID=160396 RepID=A0A840KEK1_9FLAO|nr:hypothetical protein [Chryseobacterium defluvii]MBB4806397.1 hypothetical protein [Chryseobacterium defluvii]